MTVPPPPPDGRRPPDDEEPPADIAGPPRDPPAPAEAASGEDPPPPPRREPALIAVLRRSGAADIIDLRSERLRRNWRTLRQSHPVLLATLALILAGILTVDGWLIAKQVTYAREIHRLRAGMTEVERRRADLAIASDQHHLRMTLELIRRQAEGDKELHLSIAVDSGVMYLEREGNILRDMPVEVGPEMRVGRAPDTVIMTAPRGARTIERVLDDTTAWEVPRWVYESRGLPVPVQRLLSGSLGPVAVILSGGTVLYTLPAAGPLADAAWVLPGSVRVREADLRAIAPDLRPGTSVYFY